jgi:hypothetical protein
VTGPIAQGRERENVRSMQHELAKRTENGFVVLIKRPVEDVFRAYQSRAVSKLNE